MHGCIQTCPLHYNTAPDLSWDALLKQTKIDLEHLTDIDMHLFIEKGMRGGKTWYPKGMPKQTIIILRQKITTSCIMMPLASMGGQ